MNPQKQQKINALIQEGYRLDAVDSIKQGWKILNQNMGGFIGFVLLSVLLYVASICFCGIPLLFYGNLFAGFYIVALRIQKRQSITFENFFDGFRNSNFPQILLATLVIIAITIVLYIPYYAVQLPLSFSNMATTDPVKYWSIYSVAALVLWAALVFISIIYAFAIPFIIDQRIEFWPAMELSRKVVSRQWASFLLLFVLLGLLNFVGALLCGIGLLWTTPLWFCSIMAAYNQVIGVDDSTLAPS
jgi:uncharacterized membrane protein